MDIYGILWHCLYHSNAFQIFPPPSADGCPSQVCHWQHSSKCDWSPCGWQRKVWGIGKTNKSVKTQIGYNNLKIKGMKRKPQTPDHLWSFGGTEVVFIQIWPANHWTLLIKYHLGWKKSVKNTRHVMRSWGGLAVLAYSRLRWSLHNWMPFWSWLMKIGW